MYNHAPKNYVCPLCLLVSGKDSEFNKVSDIFYQDDNILAFISPKWWKNNPGSVMVIPKKHHENIYDIPEVDYLNVYKAVKEIAAAIKKTYSCDGVSTRQHNEPAGNQDIWHFHVQVIPRYKNDRLYQNYDNSKFVSSEERQIYVRKLNGYFS